MQIFTYTHRVQLNQHGEAENYNNTNATSKTSSEKIIYDDYIEL